MINPDKFYKVTVTCGPLEDTFYKFGWELLEMSLLDAPNEPHDDLIRVEELIQN